MSCYILRYNNKIPHRVRFVRILTGDIKGTLMFLFLSTLTSCVFYFILPFLWSVLLVTLLIYPHCMLNTLHLPCLDCATLFATCNSFFSFQIRAIVQIFGPIISASPGGVSTVSMVLSHSLQHVSPHGVDMVAKLRSSSSQGSES